MLLYSSTVDHSSARSFGYAGTEENNVTPLGSWHSFQFFYFCLESTNEGSLKCEAWTMHAGT